MSGFVAVLKWVLALGFLAAIILGGAGVFLYPKIKEALANIQGVEAGTEVRTEQVTRDRLVRTVSAPAQILPGNDVNISARVSARIVELLVDPGDEVEKGQLLARLEDRDYQAALDSAQARFRAEEAMLDGARARYRNAVSEWERIESLYDSGDVSRAEYDATEAELRSAESNLRAAEQNVEVARAQVTEAEENLSYTVITSPIDGYATRVNSKVGEAVLGTFQNVGTTIMTLADFSEIIVKAEVDESDIAKIRAGQTARIYINAFEDEQFEGTVKLIDLLKTTSRTGSDVFEVDILLHTDGDRQFYSGLTASAEIEVETLEGVLTVPSQSVADVRVEELPRDIVRSSDAIDPNKTFARVVYRVKDGEAVATPVKVGPSDLRTTAILAGLEEGEEVITGPYRALIDMKHGQAVRPERDDEADAAESARPVVAADEADAQSAGDAPPAEAEGNGGDEQVGADARSSSERAASAQ